jgi:hypothetical protein
LPETPSPLDELGTGLLIRRRWWSALRRGDLVGPEFAFALFFLLLLLGDVPLTLGECIVRFDQLATALVVGWER